MRTSLSHHFLQEATAQTCNLRSAALIFRLPLATLNDTAKPRYSIHNDNCWASQVIKITVSLASRRIFASVRYSQKLTTRKTAAVSTLGHPSQYQFDNMGISYELLKKQNAETSNAIIDHWANSDDFAKLAKFEGDLTVNRDKEDADKLQVGIDYAKEKGVIDPNYVPEPYVTLDVLGKTPDEVASTIIEHVEKANAGGDASSGSVIVLCGLSGTGKVGD